jgi:hypothetical protein
MLEGVFKIDERKDKNPTKYVLHKPFHYRIMDDFEFKWLRN